MNTIVKVNNWVRICDLLMILSLMIFGVSNLYSADTPGSKKLEEKFRDYKNWVQIMDYQQSPTHWGTEIKAYIRKQDLQTFRHNHNVEQLELEGADSEELKDLGGYLKYAEGTVIVKENYRTTDEYKRKLESITFMEKQGPDDWRYIEATASFDVILDGNKSDILAMAKCHSCHEQVKHRDYLYHTHLYLDTENNNKSEIEQWLSDYHNWTLLMKFQHSPTHWDKYIKSYINDDAEIETYSHNHQMELLELDGADEEEIEEEGGYRKYKEGTVIVKENYNLKNKTDYSLDTVTFMKKLESNWRYIQVKPDGEVMVDSNLNKKDLATTSCIECHKQVEHRDYIYHTFYDEQNSSDDK